jgi:hypothetical protein
MARKLSLAVNGNPIDTDAMIQAAEDEAFKALEPMMRAQLRKSLLRSLGSAARSAPAEVESPRPREGGKCAMVWSELDRLRAKKNDVPTLADIMVISNAEGWNENNTRVEYYNWRRAAGIHGRVAPPTPAVTPAAQ